MIDHITLRAADYSRSKKFYQAALEPLGYVQVMEVGDSAGLGIGGKPDFWVAQGDRPVPQMHIAFAAATRKQVDQFYSSAIAAGGKDNGKPGVRKEYHENYYGAFVLDPDGHNIEAVCHRPQ